MKTTTRRSPLACAICLFAACLYSVTANATPINYGDFAAPPVTFTDVTESSGTDPIPLYGPPTAFSVGLDFNPLAFTAFTASGGSDLTDGQLNFGVSSPIAITNITLNERGDFSLAGTGTDTTEVKVGAILFATVTEINGVAVAPINLIPEDDSLDFDLPTNPGLVQPWSLGLNLDVAAQVAGATKVDVVINNTMFASSELNSAAFIAKKDFTIGVEVIPEPATMGMALLGLACIAVSRRRQS